MRVSLVLAKLDLSCHFIVISINGYPANRKRLRKLYANSSKIHNEMCQRAYIWNWETLSIAQISIEQNYYYHYNPISLGNLEINFARSNYPQLRRLGLATLIIQSQIQGWNAELRSRLLIYQQDDSLLVASAAAFIFPST